MIWDIASIRSDHGYPGTSVLINRFDIRDEGKLNEVESVAVSARNAEWFSEPKAASFDFEHYKAIVKATAEAMKIYR